MMRRDWRMKMPQLTGLGWMWWHEVTTGKEPFHFLFRGEIHEFDKSLFNFLKTPQQLGWFSSNTLK